MNVARSGPKHDRKWYAEQERKKIKENELKAMEHNSDNDLSVGLEQVSSQMMTIEQMSSDRELQQAANLELGIEGLDTKLQEGKMSYIEQMTAEEDRHLEKMLGYRQQHVALESTAPLQSTGADFPWPTD